MTERAVSVGRRGSMEQLRNGSLGCDAHAGYIWVGANTLAPCLLPLYTMKVHTRFTQLLGTDYPGETIGFYVSISLYDLFLGLFLFLRRERNYILFKISCVT